MTLAWPLTCFGHWDISKLDSITLDYCLHLHWGFSSCSHLWPWATMTRGPATHQRGHMERERKRENVPAIPAEAEAMEGLHLECSGPSSHFWHQRTTQLNPAPSAESWKTSLLFRPWNFAVACHVVHTETPWKTWQPPPCRSLIQGWTLLWCPWVLRGI